ncbi:D-2-hydroxyacid dehydrogenase [Albibacterium indicum]|uniref:D-2-hydroxyacid dehydrogenase n=1 Tax=Albibacterium indicum TaxID=2292082 RepID=UPI000E4BAFC1|nr:D-2-hydroxyacid dehydrogenase [Pedobacter indicus]
MRILANDGIDKVGQEMLERAGFVVDTTHIPQEELFEKLPAYDVVTVRSATKIRKDLIDACPNLKIIARGGVGMDNIDVEYAREKGIAVINTPAASSISVAELVFGHFFSGVRFLYDAQRKMVTEGDSNFAGLKKAYAKGSELRGKTLGVIGFGRIGHETAKIGVSLGMNVLVVDTYEINPTVTISFFNGQSLDLQVTQVSLDELLASADFISLHVPFLGKALIGNEEFAKMKDGAGIVNASRGGVIDENALLENLNNGKIAFAGLDVFDNEPTPKASLLRHPRVSLSPHIGAATNEAQKRVGEELATLIIQELTVTE